MLTDQQHPITPPPGLRRLWAEQAQRMDPHDPVAWLEHAATQAARWGADTELNECCHLLRQQGFDVIEDLRAARRPKPPSLAEQALMGLEQTVIMLMPVTGRKKNERFDIIRRALERLKELESAAGAEEQWLS